MRCFFWCLERFLRFLSKNAYVMCAIHGKPFCSSARDAFNLLMRNFLRVIALDQVTDFLFFLTKLLVSFGTGATAYLYFTNDPAETPLNYVAVPVIIVMIGTYLIASVFFSVYSMAVDTLFLCFCTYFTHSNSNCQFNIFNDVILLMSFYWFLRSFLAIFSGRLWKEWWLRRQTIFHVETIDEDSWQKECHTTWSI